MVLREKRREAAKLLLDFMKGRITNDQMDDAWPRDRRDAALKYVFWAKWGLYSDLREEYIQPKLRRSFVVAKQIHQCLTFLRSDLEYEWAGNGLSHGLCWFADLFNKERRAINRAGDNSVWPFYRRDDYKRTWKLAH